MSSGFHKCTTITPSCPVEATIYGYYPSLVANVFFAAAFGFYMVLNIAFAVRYRTVSYGIALILGCMTEVVGYIGRIMMHHNPWSQAGFDIQICCLIIAPAFMSAGIYLTLKHLTLCFGSEHSRIKPALYTWIFIFFDLFSLVLQGTGGGLAASGKASNTIDTGNDIMLAGICFQVVTLSVFALMALDYYLRFRRSKLVLSPKTETLQHDIKFKLFITALVIAFLSIYIRCVYRIVEMAGGWGNTIMRDETGFIVLEGAMILVAVSFLTIFHPGYCFPQLRSHHLNAIDDGPSTYEMVGLKDWEHMPFE
ncbi:RTA1 domain-containing protein [Lipomyces kononenkoae]|uniref:RTA1 domain-containing protein n=1 Tax=Lipomyces kononenkoae TaxID=34357 RepID=A0ACC3SR28_LIPKO